MTTYTEDGKFLTKECLFCHEELPIKDGYWKGCEILHQLKECESIKDSYIFENIKRDNKEMSEEMLNSYYKDYQQYKISLQKG